MNTLLAIDFADFLTALENRSTKHTYYLDSQTGDVVEHSRDGDENQEVVVEPNDVLPPTFSELLLRFPDRYLPIAVFPPKEYFFTMRDFVKQLPNSLAKTLLNKALTMPKPAMNFKQYLARYPAEAEQWYRYYDEKLQDFGENWLKSHHLGFSWKEPEE